MKVDSKTGTVELSLAEALVVLAKGTLMSELHALAEARVAAEHRTVELMYLEIAPSPAWRAPPPRK